MWKYELWGSFLSDRASQQVLDNTVQNNELNQQRELFGEAIIKILKMTWVYS